MRLIIITLVSLMCAVPLAVLAEPTSPRQGPNRAGPGTGRNMGRPGNDEKFKEELATFCKEHSPKRWAVIDAMPKGQQKEQRIAMMAWQFGILRGLKNEDKSRYELKVKEIELQDQEFGILQNPQKLSEEALRMELKDTAEKVVQARLDDRDLRIKDLENRLKKEKEELESDKAKITQLVSEHLNQLIKQGPSLFPSPGFRHGGEGAHNDSTRPARNTTVNNVPANPDDGN